MTTTEAMPIRLKINGEAVTAFVEPRQHLADFLRLQLQLTGSHVGCEHGVCGACTVRMNGDSVRGCLTLAVQADGAEIETIEGLTESGEIADIQASFHRRNALQCGFCTPAMLVTTCELLAGIDHVPSREEVRDYLSGNYCRCTGYQAIVDAVIEVAEARFSGGRS